MLDTLKRITEGKRVCLLGFGREGRSTYKFLRKAFPGLNLTVADRDETLIKQLPGSMKKDPCLSFIVGDSYLARINEFDLIIKSPGITLHTLKGIIPPEKLTSQTDLFLNAYHGQVVGVTGTKGKSTTSSLIYHMMRQSSDDVLLVGNIGTAPFELVTEITEHTKIVFELSSHQLETISRSPKTAVILNLLPEHLDHFRDIGAYHAAKLNIAGLQDQMDYLIYHNDDQYLTEAIETVSQGQERYTYSLGQELNKGCFLHGDDLIFISGQDSVTFEVGDFKLRGRHNLLNLMAAVLACKLNHVDDAAIAAGISSFRGLRHRLEFIGTFGGIHFYDDSIATIPEATMEAVKALGKIDVLILGGYDRKIDYNGLISFLILAEVNKMICIGQAGQRIYEGLKDHGAGQALFRADDYEEVFEIIRAVGKQDGICLLSPAAASYDMFNNFEERGELFTKLAKTI